MTLPSVVRNTSLTIALGAALSLSACQSPRLVPATATLDDGKARLTVRNAPSGAIDRVLRLSINGKFVTLIPLDQSRSVDVVPDTWSIEVTENVASSARALAAATQIAVEAGHEYLFDAQRKPATPTETIVVTGAARPSGSSAGLVLTARGSRRFGIAAPAPPARPSPDATPTTASPPGGASPPAPARAEPAKAPPPAPEPEAAGVAHPSAGQPAHTSFDIGHVVMNCRIGTVTRRLAIERCRFQGGTVIP